MSASIRGAIVALTLLYACSGPQPKSHPAADTGSPSADTATDTAPPDIPRAALQLAFPLPERDRITLRIGVDHDPVEQEGVIGSLICTDYLGRTFPHCYDQHEGSDYILKDGFDAMDAGSTPITAAAPGIVERVEDGNYDRCHGSLETGDVDCDGYEMRSNTVEIRHETGHLVRYLHMKKDSIEVAIGQAVETGEVLGLVGSSGRSSMPHLHLQVEDPTGLVIDPYAGPYSQEETYWCEQEASDGFPGPCEG